MFAFSIVTTTILLSLSFTIVASRWVQGGGRLHASFRAAHAHCLMVGVSALSETHAQTGAGSSLLVLFI
uniref:Secreted protein n=1 Tax=Caenorhabditis japonica TaxID=281687 RepID=A0A8R1IT89_CAEJA